MQRFPFTRFSMILAAGLMCAALAGCNLGAAETTAEPPTLPPTRTAVPTVGVAGATLTPIPTSATGAAQCSQHPNWETYTIQRGDTLTSIARRMGTTVEILIEGNCLDDPNHVRAGQEIKVPPPPGTETAQPGTTPAGTTYADPNGFSFVYPPAWHLTESAGGPVVVTSYDPANEPPPAAWTPDMTKISFGIVPPAQAAPTLGAWVQQQYSELGKINATIENEETILLPGGLQGVRLTLVSDLGRRLQNVYFIIGGRNLEVTVEGNLDQAEPVIQSLQAR